MDPKHLAKLAEGLVLLTGCRKGRVPTLLAEGRHREAEEALVQYLEWFGTANVFVELQQNLVRGDTQRNRRLIELSRKLGVGVVATNNVHYHAPERRRLQDALVAVRHNQTLEETHRERRPNGQFYLKSPAKMVELFRECPEAVETTLRIAGRCTFDLTRDLGYQFPDYPVPEGFTSQTYLERLCYQAAERRYGGVTEAVKSRLREEFRLVQRHNLAGFLLIYYDIIQLARQIMIELGLSDPEIPLEERPPGRGRGSSVAMLVGYLIGLSHIDPLEFNLSLERFLSDDMSSVPDIDLDFPRNIREELIKRVHEKWGWDHAALSGMISTYQLKGAIRDLGKALGLPRQEVGKLAKRVDSHSARELKLEMLGLPEFRDKVDAPVWRDLIDLAAQLDGFPKYLAQHPGGMIISSAPLIDMAPVQQGAIEGRYICQWDKDSIAQAGFVKIDFLALGALSQM
ncbi:MAG: PHP domain-containing protein, partial [candidate division NC10 bacterium]